MGQTPTLLKAQHIAQLKLAIKERVAGLQVILREMKEDYDSWLKNLKESRNQCPLLMLYSNHEIMTLILLLQKSTDPHSIRKLFLKRLYAFKDANQQKQEDEYAFHTLLHYLRSLRVSRLYSNMDQLKQLFALSQVEPETEIEVCLRKLGEFIQTAFRDEQRSLTSFTGIDKSQQYIVRMKSLASTGRDAASFELSLDRDTYCVILNLFHNQLPASYQILWCSNATATDIELFFARIRAFPSLIFVVLDIDRMHHSLRETLFNEQDSLTKEKSHGTVYYFSEEISTARKVLREFHIPSAYRDPEPVYRLVMELFRSQRIPSPSLRVIYGEPGVGK